MRSFLLACVVLMGCGGWPAVEPAPRNELTAEQSEAYRALAHALSNYMNARAANIDVNLELAGILEEVLLHARAFEDSDWRQARNQFEAGFSKARVPSNTVVTVTLTRDAPYSQRWAAGEQLSGDPVLDNLIRRYDIKVVNDRWLTAFDLVVSREVNGYALGNQIAQARGILSPIAGWDMYAWGNSFRIGDSILVRPDARNGGWRLKIVVGWGDCPSGCTRARIYSFEIDTSGETRLVEVSGDPLGAIWARLRLGDRGFVSVRRWPCAATLHLRPRSLNACMVVPVDSRFCQAHLG